MTFKHIGIFGSCQLHLCNDFFLDKTIQNENKIIVKFSIPSYIYHDKYPGFKKELDYNIFNDIDILIIELNNYTNNSSSDKIIEFCKQKNIQIIKTCLIAFPIFPINWSGYGENYKDYINWVEIDKIDYKKKFNKIINSLKDKFSKSDLDIKIVEFIEENFNKKLLFTHSLHPTNILLFELWKSILKNLNIDIKNYSYNFKKELINCWHNPFTSKMIEDLDIKFKTKIDDNFYINRFEQNKVKILKNLYEIL